MATHWKRAASLSELTQRNCLTTHVGKHILALFYYQDEVFAIDNRCPHMGFPLDDGTLQDGILTCHWHHARFDLASGGTFDPWADDVRVFPTELRGDEVWVDVAPQTDPMLQHSQRLREGLQRNISLVIAKSAIAMHQHGVDLREPFHEGVNYGVRFQRNGWGQGLTILTCMMNLMPWVEETQRAQALFHGLSAVASDNDMASPRHLLPSLPSFQGNMEQLTRWFRQFIEVRDAEGAERAIITAYQGGASRAELAEMLFAAATDHRYINGGHTLDFINKALEALDITDWEDAEAVLSSLTPILADAQRMEESNAWRHPIDLVAIVERSFDEIPQALAEGKEKQPAARDTDELQDALFSDDPQAIAKALLIALKRGFRPEDLAAEVAFAAARRIAHFHTSNEFGDWDTALHTFTFANAVHQGLVRIPSLTLLRGVWDAAMSIYLDRFLNIPAARIPSASLNGSSSEELLQRFSGLLDHQQQVNEAAQLTLDYTADAGSIPQLLAKLGELLLREDRDFHTIQCLEAAARQLKHWQGTERTTLLLVAAARYLAAHAPTMRAQRQTFLNAQRLSRGELLHSDS
ncbi:MAG: Rieske (2Fe-2S) protein [Chloroflexi bacterium]|nr:Rieske (2Fe-2S) protein [Chloroflexota bacterium]